MSRQVSMQDHPEARSAVGTPDLLSTFAEHQRQHRFDMRRDFDPDSLLPVVGMEREGWLARFQRACVALFYRT